jgi:hypothetical protein
MIGETKIEYTLQSQLVTQQSGLAKLKLGGLMVDNS